MQTLAPSAPPLAIAEIVERTENGLVILSAGRRTHRRILYVNSYGGATLWRRIKAGEMPPHHLWGCLQLARMGYEVALAEPLPDFYLRRNPLPHDLRLLRFVRDWLGQDGIVYCGHNVLFWLPLLRALGAVRCPIASLLFARESLDLAGGHAAVIALNPVAAEHARSLAPRAKIAHLAWGADLEFFPEVPYRPEWALSCGITFRDHRTLSIAAERSPWLVTILCAEAPAGVRWPVNVHLVLTGRGINTDPKNVSYAELLERYYGSAAVSLIITGEDRAERGACGFTNLIESMALARPVIMTRTGALPSEIDVEASGCGLFVPPADPEALATALDTMMRNPEHAQQMGLAGRRLCEERYNIDRYAAELHALFETL